MPRNPDRRVQTRPRVLVAVPSWLAYGRATIEAVIGYARRHTEWELLFSTRPGTRGGLRTSGRPIDGVIADGNAPHIAERVAELGAPSVMMSGAERLNGAGWVVVDNAAVGRTAAEYLAGLGFERFGFCGVRGRWTSPVRGDAFARRVRERVPDAELHEVLERETRVHDWDAESATLLRWVREVPKPIAVFANHDDRARQLAIACQEAGIHVPERLAILGVNNDELTCEMAHPPLSSVDHNARGMGAEAAAMLDRMLRTGRVPADPVVIKPIGVVSRRSTDILAIDDPVLARAVRLIRERATDGHGVAEVLRELPIGRRTLEVGFKDVLGRTPHQEVLRVRLERARYLLRESSLDLPAITARCGFKYPSQLSAVFKKHEGESPTAYRARHGR